MVCWQAPSNIALVKYWGKHGEQLPSNPSISMTLKNSKTITGLEWKKSDTPSSDIRFRYFFEGQENQNFSNKVALFLNRLSQEIEGLNQFEFTIHSKNTFPHSAGIASSASSMAALVCCIDDFASINKLRYKNSSLAQMQTEQRRGFLARLGSGSACRSVYGGYVSWGSESLEIPFQHLDIHEEFMNWRDSILIIDSNKKSVSSRMGHALMNQHPYAKTRFEQAKHHHQEIIESLKLGDTKRVCAITKKESWELHALMMLASPPFCLIRPNSLYALEKIENAGESWSFPWTYTLDAGPNIHLLYPSYAHDQVQDFIQRQLADFLEEGKWIEDEVGEGPSTHDWIF